MTEENGENAAQIQKGEIKPRREWDRNMRKAGGLQDTAIAATKPASAGEMKPIHERGTLSHGSKDR